MSKPKILICLDSDSQSSVFDSVVAVDSGVDHLFRHGHVTGADVEGLIHGGMFTRGPEDLKNSAVFIGGSDVAEGELLLKKTLACFFGPMRMSVLLDANGSNTTAAAAVIAAGRHVDFSEGAIGVVIGTGPVGQRAGKLLASEGVHVRMVSRTKERATEACEQIGEHAERLTPCGSTESSMEDILADAQVVIACGPAGIEVLSQSDREAAKSLKVVVDLNAVPPLGIGGIEVMDKAIEREGQIHYGAIGVGGTKMKIHKAAIRRLFETNDAVLDAAEVYKLGKSLE